MTEYITPTTWEECAAHVEAGGVVEIEDAPGVWINDRAAATTYRGRCGTPDDGWAPRRLVPIESAAPANGVPAVPTGAERYLAERLADPEYRDAYEAAAPVTGDDLPERRVWTCKIGGRVGRLSGGADAPMRRAVADAFTAETGCPVEFCFSGWGDDLDESELAVVEDRAPDPEAIRAALVKRLTAIPPPEPPAPDDLVSRARRHAETHPESRELIEELLETVVRWACFAAPPPVPPWPGAVLSGLTDEDGVPTWLAQAGQVRGGMVRCSRNLSWVKNNGGHGPGVWVEVRDPRAVPEPETERVPWWEALGRLGLAGDPFVEVGSGDEGPWVRVVEGGTKLYSPVAPDGTVKVLVEVER